MKVKITFSFYLLKKSHLDMINLVVDFVIYKDVLNKKYYIIYIKNIWCTSFSFFVILLYTRKE